MIRDEFIKQQKEKSLSNREMEKIRKFGERAFYTTQINNIVNYSKVLNFSCIILSVMLVLPVFMLVVGFIADGFSSSVLLYTIIVAVILFAVLGWFFILKPMWKKKLVKYKNALEQVREKELQKQRQIYNKFVK
jgi:archaellum biogenesis protein FlaJ (TadC family)